MTDINYTVEVYNIYEKHMIDTLTKPTYFFLCDILKNMEVKQKNKMLKEFQEKMKSLVKLDYENLKRHARSILEKTNKKYTQKLIQAVIISKNKMLVATIKNRKVNSDTEVPHTTEFFAKFLSEIGKYFHNNPHFVCDNSGVNGLTNAKLSMEAITDIIKATVDSFVSYNDIIDIYISTINDESDDEEEPQAEEDDEEDVEIEDYDTEVDDEDDEESYHENEEASDDISDAESVHSVESTGSVESNGSAKSSRSVESTHSRQSSKDDEYRNELPQEREESVPLTDDNDLPDGLNMIPLQPDTQAEAQINKDTRDNSDKNVKKIVFFSDAKKYSL